jgi:hypothetical protein
VAGGEHERTVTVEGLVEPLFDHLRTARAMNARWTLKVCC